MTKKPSTQQQRRKDEKARRRKQRQGRRTVVPLRDRDRRETDLLMTSFADMQARGVFADMPAVFNPPGQEKMSEVLEDFVEPYLDYTGDVEPIKELMVIATVAWNAALMEGDMRASFLHDVLEAIPPDARDDTRGVIAELIQRKLKHFAAYRRLIASVQVTDTGDGFHLAVASFEPGPPA